MCMVTAMDGRLSKADWLKQGLQALARQGPGALKAAQLAHTLKVSRGSFYWHFRDIADFRANLLRAWEEVATDRVIKDLDDRTGKPGVVRQLLERAFAGPRKLDQAIRSWAAEDRNVAAAVAKVDAKRIAHIARLLAEAGVTRETAGHRATFLYWAYLGNVAIADPRRASIPPNAVASIAALFETEDSSRSN